MSTLRLVLGDQLSLSLPIFTEADKASDIFLMCEVQQEATYVKHHKKKIAFLFSAMRHFAILLKSHGYNIRYIEIGDPHNTHSFDGEVSRAITELNLENVVVTAPGEWRVYEKFCEWKENLGVPVEILPDTRFFCTVKEFKVWTLGRVELRMEYFYRVQRRRHDIMMQNGKPLGGKWNYDKENRKPPARHMQFPKRISFKKDQITEDVLKTVDERFADHPGDLHPFHFAVTREQALLEAKHFFKTCLPDFGAYQDAMLAEEAFLYHSLLSAYLNAGLLEPRELCAMAEAEYHAGNAPISSVEGYIRQILGWREYIRGVYWIKMPGYGTLNYFNAKRPLPDFYWDGQTDMHCLSDTIKQTMKNAHSHHIQRLMITGNFALIAGLDVDQVCEWYLVVYADAYEWVELPNTRGMALFADGGLLGSKPYAASGNYINRMSNFCSSCQYDPKEVLGENACPFNALYWDFLIRNEDKLRGNQRLRFAYVAWDRMTESKQEKIRTKAAEFLASSHMKSGAY